MNSPRLQQERVKLLIIGDSAVGKSSILQRFARDSFSTSYITTIGIDFQTKMMIVGGREVKVQVFDTAGQCRFRSITNSYYRGADAILLVYDVTDRRTFHGVEYWSNNIDEHASGDVIRVLIGNKCDSAEERDVSEEEGQVLASKSLTPFFETSAKSDVNVKEAFDAAVQMVLRRKQQRKNERVQVVDIAAAPRAASSSVMRNTCCS